MISSLAQEFILNQQYHETMCSTNYENGMRDQQQLNQAQQSLPPDRFLLVTHNQRVIDRNSYDREMTPDSINNDQENEEAPTNQIRRHNNKSNNSIQKKTNKTVLNRPLSGSLNRGAVNQSQQAARTAGKARPPVQKQS